MFKNYDLSYKLTFLIKSKIFLMDKKTKVRSVILQSAKSRKYIYTTRSKCWLFRLASKNLIKIW